MSWKMSLFATCVLEFWSYITEDTTSKTLGYKNSCKKNPVRLFLFVFWNVCPCGLLKSYFLVFIYFYKDRIFNREEKQITCIWNSYLPQKSRRRFWKSSVIKWGDFKRHDLGEADLGCSISFTKFPIANTTQ